MKLSLYNRIFKISVATVIFVGSTSLRAEPPKWMDFGLRLLFTENGRGMDPVLQVGVNKFFGGFFSSNSLRIHELGYFLQFDDQPEWGSGLYFGIGRSHFHLEFPRDSNEFVDISSNYGLLTLNYKMFFVGFKHEEFDLDFPIEARNFRNKNVIFEPEGLTELTLGIGGYVTD